MATGRKVVIEFSGRDNAGAAVARVVKQLDGVKNRLQALDRESADPKVGADVAVATAKLNDIRGKLEFLGKQKASPEVTAQTEDAKLQLEIIKQKMREIDGKVLHVKTKVSFSKKLGGGLESMLGSLSRVPFAGSLLANPYTIIPTLAAAAGALAAAVNVALSLGTALGAAAGGAVALKLALSNLRLTQAGKDFAEFEKRLKGIKREFQRMAQRNILPGLQAGIKSAIGGLGGSARGAWSGITKGLGDEFRRLGRQLGNDPNIKRFLHIIGKQAPAAFRNLGDIAFNTIGIITKLFNAFSTGKGKSDPLKSLAGSVRRFNKSLDSAKVQRFTEDVRGVAKAFGIVMKVMGIVPRMFWRVVAKLIDGAVHWQESLNTLRNAFANAASAIIRKMGDLMAGWASMLRALSHVPGFGWAAAAANAMQNAANKAHNLAGSIAALKSKNITVTTTYSEIHTTYSPSNRPGAIRQPGHLAKGGPVRKDTTYLVGEEGPELFVSKTSGHIITAKKTRQILSGMGHSFALPRALGRVTDYIQRHVAKLRELLEKRRDVISSFRGMSSSVFGQDLSTESRNGVIRKATSGSLVAYQRSQATKAKRLVRDLRKLRKAGISDNLLRQMVSAGESGWDNIHALASGPVSDLRALNRANAETNKALTHAGQMTAQSLGYGPGAIKYERKAVERGRHLEHVLKKIDRHLDHGGRTVVEVHLDGRVLRSSLVRLKRKSGKNLGLA